MVAESRRDISGHLIWRQTSLTVGLQVPLNWSISLAEFAR
jgi:hypothetical protein